MSWLSTVSALGSSRSQFTSRMAPCPSGPHVHVAWGRGRGQGVKRGWGPATITPPSPTVALGGSHSPLSTLSSSVLLTAPLRLVSASSEMSAGRGVLRGGASPPAPRFGGVPLTLTHTGEVQHGSAHGHPAGLPKIRNPDLQQGAGARHHAEKGWILLVHPAPTFSSPTSLLRASMASSTSAPAARGQRPTLEGNLTLCVSCTT